MLFAHITELNATNAAAPLLRARWWTVDRPRQQTDEACQLLDQQTKAVLLSGWREVGLGGRGSSHCSANDAAGIASVVLGV